jgi:hypothetical protein
MGSGEVPTDYGSVDCPDCGGAGFLPSRHVLIDWRARDIERSLAQRDGQDAADLKWTVAEMRQARAALIEIVALAHDVQDNDVIAQRIRFVANRALGLYEIGDASKSPEQRSVPRDNV